MIFFLLYLRCYAFSFLTNSSFEFWCLFWLRIPSNLPRCLRAFRNSVQFHWSTYYNTFPSFLCSHSSFSVLFFQFLTAWLVLLFSSLLLHRVFYSWVHCYPRAAGSDWICFLMPHPILNWSIILWFRPRELPHGWGCGLFQVAIVGCSEYVLNLTYNMMIINNHQSSIF